VPYVLLVRCRKHSVQFVSISFRSLVMNVASYLAAEISGRCVYVINTADLSLWFTLYSEKTDFCTVGKCRVTTYHTMRLPDLSSRAGKDSSTLIFVDIHIVVFNFQHFPRTSLAFPDFQVCGHPEIFRKYCC